MKQLTARHPERRQSLQRKLGLLNIGGLAVAGVLVCVLLGSWSWFTQRADLVRTTESVARVLAENAAPAIQFNDPVGAAEILRALSSHPEIMTAELSIAPDELFARYVWPRPAPAGPIEGIGRLLSIGERSVDVRVPVLAQGEVLGSLRLTVDLAPTYARVYASLVAILGIVGAVFGVVLALQSRALARMLDPVRQLVASMRRVSETADYGHRAHVHTHDEIGELGETFNAMMGLIQERDQAMEHLALHDSLTGLHNRHYLRIRARRPVIEPGDRCALFYIDIDDFKQINDNLDHNVGDRVLMAAASRLGAVAGDHDLLVRFGGDEFVFCAYAFGPDADPEALAQRLREAVAAPLFVDGRELTARASVGIAFSSSETASKAMRRAPRAASRVRAGCPSSIATDKIAAVDWAAKSSGVTECICGTNSGSSAAWHSAPSQSVNDSAGKLPKSTSLPSKNSSVVTYWLACCTCIPLACCDGMNCKRANRMCQACL